MRLASFCVLHVSAIDLSSLNARRHLHLSGFQVARNRVGQLHKLKRADKRGCIHAILGRNRYFADTITRRQNDAFPSCDRLDGSGILNNGSTFPCGMGRFSGDSARGLRRNASQVSSFKALARVLKEAVLEIGTLAKAARLRT